MFNKNGVTKNTVTKNTVTNNTIANNTIAKNTVTKNTIAKNTIAKNPSNKNVSSKKKRRRIAAALMVFIFIIGFVAFRHGFLMGLIRTANAVKGTITGQAPINILLIGNNARDAAGPLSLGTAAGQADIIILVHDDPKTHKITMISIPRDTLFAMPGWNEPIPKIKSIFTLGLAEAPEKGPELAMQAVSKFTGMPVNHYVVTDFKGFADAINAVGGVTINVQARLYDPEHSGVNLQPGVQTLNGDQALAFIRVRQNDAGNDYRVNDFQRQQAEMEMMQALKKKLLDSSTDPAKLEKLVQTWHKDVATDLSTSELVSLGMDAVGSQVQEVTLGSVADSMDIVDAPLVGANSKNYIMGAYYDVLDPDEITEQLKPFGSTGASTGFGALPKPADVPVLVFGSQAVAEQLRQKGFTVKWGGPTASGSQIQVFYPQGKMPWGWVVGRALGTANELVEPAVHYKDQAVVYAP